VQGHAVSDARRFFDAIASRYDRAYALDARTSRARMERVLRELSPASRVLDLGVGTGRELSALQDAGHDPVGLDFSTEMLARCDRRARRVPLVQADFWARLPFDAASFDAALALHGTLAHPPRVDAVDALAVELARVLRPGGVFVAEVPARAWLDALPAHAAEGEERRVRRLGDDRCLYEDLVAGVSIEAWIPGDDAWRDVFRRAGMTAVVEALDEAEAIVVARSAPGPVMR
jgi:SAM-dependent methyltransferase